MLRLKCLRPGIAAEIEYATTSCCYRINLSETYKKSRRVADMDLYR